MLLSPLPQLLDTPGNEIARYREVVRIIEDQKPITVTFQPMPYSGNTRALIRSILLRQVQ
jgi:hypothetical protein